MGKLEKITVVLLSWKRLKNIPIILDSLYRSKDVDEIILWNNNTTVQFSYKNKKLLLFNSPSNFGTSARWCVALLAKNPNILFIDDDLVLTPSQINILLKKYLSDNKRIYGCFGKNLEDNKYVFKTANGEVDIVLGRVMLFNKRYLYQFFQWSQGKVGNVEDDILFSLIFRKKHYVVDVGEIKELPSPYALWRKKGHGRLRQEMVDYCLKYIT
ncbi:MAG: hypothetical protein UU73_C0001G0066 [Candidatus Daviesbacteria bacterium GW2011_GWA1_41_61]|uniref:Glycosyl transferase 64 domain-containing protein n=1 Tax=Candidatus Daviesbacteria bacterium GW2011_GWA2_40_9 TaxID=1618424 RepID=A0A0G0U1G9_9BACT|nr:MAG: hypothetical protein UU26_C0002G0037 [Candidatus Daviesbacteria bacterium GW2011_GWC1_40_9]KKR82958.1 MAG: hypothetical protein UU29_C0008G0067 [Candidatus Daviesbacteria bacterium GW2011_GWA2_40_9]KKR92885.1 MAG: hypothetical protein UU44_C0004G0067 [Candidatus Daviesbacteria bacterium GW2011_GWB1_41_15]KKS15429.1 MAG: hypothetical protein UU73_C0001G0066 [Candidatus Daviesbacteria bacterium GW2011_GWA1_41_61]